MKSPKCVYCMNPIDQLVDQLSVACVFCGEYIHNNFWSTVFNSATWESNPEDDMTTNYIIPIIRSYDTFFIGKKYKHIIRKDAFVHTIIMSLNWKNLYFISLRKHIPIFTHFDTSIIKFSSDRLCSLLPYNISPYEYIGGIIII